MYADPAPCYTELTAQRPFLFNIALGWRVAASARVIDAVLDNAACCARPADRPVSKTVATTPTGESFDRLACQIDDPDHSARKAKATTALGRLDVSTLADHAQQHACTTLSEAANLDATLDTDTHFRVPFATMAHTLLGNGVDAPTCQADIAAHLAALGPGASVIAAAQADAAVGRLQQCFADSSSTGTGADGSSDTDIANLAALLAQTYDTYAELFDNCIVASSRHVRLAARLYTQPDAIKPFVRKILRRDTPVQNARYFIAYDADLLGHPLCMDDRILVLLAGASLNGITNPDPLRLNVDRMAPRLWTFDGDVHHCPADALAITIARRTMWHLLSLREVSRWLAGLGGVAHYPSPSAHVPRFQA